MSVISYILYDPKNFNVLATVNIPNAEAERYLGHAHRINLSQISFREGIKISPTKKQVYAKNVSLKKIPAHAPEEKALKEGPVAVSGGSSGEKESNWFGRLRFWKMQRNNLRRNNHEQETEAPSG